MKDFIFSILKMIIVVFIIFLIPFMLPIILKIFLKIGLFLNIEEFKNIVAIFNNMYVFIYILLGMLIYAIWQEC